MPYRPKPHRAPVIEAPRRLRRPSAAQRGYGTHWRKLRAYVLARYPLCADPFGHHAAEGRYEPACEVDHVVPRAEGGTDEEENLQPLCATCHARKTVLYDGGFGRPKRSMDTVPGEGRSETERNVS